MTICKYWRQGNCRNGSNCRFEHPNGRNSSNDSGSTNQRGGFGNGGAFGNLNRSERWHLNEEDIRSDLTTTRPKWILSSYGPGKDVPASLFPDNEYSVEEVRLRFYEAQATGQSDQADREAINVWQKADAGMRDVASKVHEVQKYMESKEKEHPNRYDFTNVTKFNGAVSATQFAKDSQLNSQPGSSMNPFGGAARAAESTNPFSKPAFGDAAKPSPFGQTTKSAFGQPAFGQPAQSSGFGQNAQPSPFGQPAQPSAFGKPAGFGQGTQSSAFGQTSQPSSFGKPAFGQPAQSAAFGQTPQPSAFGGSAQGPAFGQAAQPSGFGQSGFGQPQAKFGQPSIASSPFGAKPSGNSAFGQASGLGQATSANPFAKPSAAVGFGAGTGFGAGAANPNAQSAFGQPIVANNNQSPFGQQIPQNRESSPFGQQHTAVSGPQQTAFGSVPSQPSTFGQQGNTPAPSPFGQAPQTDGSSAFGAAATGGQGAFGDGGTQTKSLGPNPFGKVLQGPNQPGQSSSAFEQQQQPAAPTQARSLGPNPFAAPAPAPAPDSGSRSSRSRPTANGTAVLTYSQSLRSGPTNFSAHDRLISYKGMPIEYDVKMKPTITGEEVVDLEIPCYHRPDGKGLERVWFPKGDADPAVQRLYNKLGDIEAEQDKYTDEVTKQFSRLFENGRFDNDKLPLIPPMHEWVDYNF